MTVPLARPDISEREIELVLQVLRSPDLSGGPFLARFERLVAEYVGARHAIAVSSGTAGLHMAVAALEIRDGDEVITTPFSFVASANCILYERAQPVFVDIEPAFLNIDVERIERAITARTRAILPVHVFGHPCVMDEIAAVAAKHGLAVIEDACEALGARYAGRPAGTFGDCGVFAFYPNKQMTTGEGGVIVTDRDDLADVFRSQRNQGRDRGGAWLHHVRLGYNYRLDECSAALGVAQLERIEELLARRARVAALYRERLRQCVHVEVPSVSPAVTMSWFVYVVRLPAWADRDRVAGRLLERGVPTRPYFAPIHLQPYYRKRFGFQAGVFPVAERVGRSTLALPFFGGMTEDAVDEVCMALTEALGQEGRP
jgi:perosamine synthetase